MGFRVPKGYGWLTNPKKAAYNRMYYRRKKGCAMVFMILISIPISIYLILN